jgi:hypothetical protein
MEPLKSFLNSFWGANCVQIYAVALMLVFLKIVFKYITKMDVLKISAKADAATRKAVHFECLRIGVDLVVLGIVTLLSIIRVALSLGSSLDKSLLTSLSTLQGTLVVFQLILLGLATLSTGIFDSADRSYKRGVYVPNVLGVISIIVSVGAFFFISQGR